MSGRLRLEVFGQDTNAAETVVIEAAAMEEARLASFEAGYAAGWEDAMAAQKEERSSVSADLARSLQALSFTYHEARAHVLAALQPLLVALVSRVLPGMARDNLAPIVAEALRPLAELAADTPVTIELNPAARPALEALLAGHPGPPVRLVEEPTLGEGQVYLRLGDREDHIDLDHVTDTIRAAVTGFFHPLEEIPQHG
ncbi:MAG: flagellar biosynthesis protein [Rhodobacteraceae bacterium]|nr:flagellar biosynthesis protein [Paracoccaceae bacterium]